MQTITDQETCGQAWGESDDEDDTTTVICGKPATTTSPSGIPVCDDCAAVWETMITWEGAGDQWTT